MYDCVCSCVSTVFHPSVTVICCDTCKCREYQIFHFWFTEHCNYRITTPQITLNFWKALFNWHVVRRIGRKKHSKSSSFFYQFYGWVCMMNALSRMTTLLGLLPLNGNNWGCRLCLMKSQNVLPCIYTPGGDMHIHDSIYAHCCNSWVSLSPDQWLFCYCTHSLKRISKLT